MMGWILCISLVLFFPSIFWYANPFLVLIGRAIQQRAARTALFAACLTGLCRDIVLSTPHLGICGLSSLCSAALLIRLSSLFPIEPLPVMVCGLSILEYFLDTLFCAFCSEQSLHSFFQFWSWRALLLTTLFSTGIALVPSLGALVRIRRKT